MLTVFKAFVIVKSLYTCSTNNPRVSNQRRSQHNLPLIAAASVTQIPAAGCDTWLAKITCRH